MRAGVKIPAFCMVVIFGRVRSDDHCLFFLWHYHRQFITVVVAPHFIFSLHNVYKLCGRKVYRRFVAVIFIVEGNPVKNKNFRQAVFFEFSLPRNILENAALSSEVFRFCLILIPY
jgi:hypothetical protein